MFVSEAHSVVQQSRLAITLAWIAGYTNAVTLLVCHTATSHISGTADNLGIGLISQNWPIVGFSAFLLVAFVAGAALSGIALELGRMLRWNSIYVLPMALQGALLTGFAITIEFSALDELPTGNPLLLATGLTSLAMGLQNATITRISRGVVRTTHVTGVLTDLGLEAVQCLSSKWLRRDGSLLPLESSPTAERLLLLASIVGSFVFGAALGTAGFEAFPKFAMFPPVLFIAWIILVDVLKPIAEIVPAREYESEASPTVSVFKVKPDRVRRGENQRMPNLAHWAEIVPRSTTTSVLDLSDIEIVSSNSIEELQRLAICFRAQGRALRIVGCRSETQLPSDGALFFASLPEALSPKEKLSL